MDLLPLFVETVEDLRVRSSLTSTAYDAIQAAGLMRRLLVDKTAIGPEASKAVRRRGEPLDAPIFEWAAFLRRRQRAKRSHDLWRPL